MKKFMYIAVLVALVSGAGAVYAIDAPHNNEDCSGCHVFHAATGTGLTSNANNWLVCLACHDQPTNAYQLLPADQADLSANTGTSHRWDSQMCGAAPLDCGPNSTLGLRQPAVDPNNPVSPTEIQDIGLNKRLRSFNDYVTCSVCHNQHGHARSAWDVDASAYFFSGRADTGSTDTTIVDLDAGWTPGALVGNTVLIISGAHNGQSRAITANDATSITFATLGSAVDAEDSYNISDGAGFRHFMRMDNDLNQLCEDCHFYRIKTYATVEDTTLNGATVLSHPVAQTLNANARSYDRAAPLDADGVAQSGTRFAAGNDADDTNNVIVGSDNTIRCLTCHRIHYSDSNSLTPDVP